MGTLILRGVLIEPVVLMQLR
ncbi:hypothetical protein A2U01_0050149, partial [Trifolium medium]|nr:hypothetical protein [Trifolium medium]